MYKCIFQGESSSAPSVSAPEVERTAQQVPTPAQHVPTPAQHVPTPAQHVPTPAQPVATPAPQVPYVDDLNDAFIEDLFDDEDVGPCNVSPLIALVRQHLHLPPIVIEPPGPTIHLVPYEQTASIPYDAQILHIPPLSEDIEQAEHVTVTQPTLNMCVPVQVQI